MNSQHKELLTTSEAAFNASLLPSTTDLRAAASLNGDIVSGSESDIPESYVKITSLASEEAKALIYKREKHVFKEHTGLKLKPLQRRDFFLINYKEYRSFPDLEKQ